MDTSSFQGHVAFGCREIFIGILDALLHIPSYYPIRDLSDSTMQVETLQKFIKNGLCKGMMNKISSNDLLYNFVLRSRNSG
jgi:uncharacterized ubiquitin-like protein YukD